MFQDFVRVVYNHFYGQCLEKYIELNVRNMAADVVAEFMKHFKNLEKHWAHFTGSSVLVLGTR